MQNYASMTTKDRASMVMKLYVGAAMDYEKDVVRLNLTDEHKKYLSEKRAFLVEAHTIIGLYKQYAETGLVPTLEMEQQMLRLIDEFLLYPALGY
jgi:hypothetical protein